ncbi:hypothetical protein LTR10_015211 [Elasticomyces elasticus]|uniref:Apple domain-containing protein n=1 Tax=Exophiala sideris TaxID=1016849 RepID=A0ABR0JF07_9EURO|nr:hypothetical protein LTR10_015211 [Elasticomyces elasticus]KAK5032686.1 hypothetical protein LTS07_004096 [Exophiala sideris]KAK5037134.1 hypothetical protein LTR13_004939 [Exophiala sideris]KAK5062210.1 hypothetical protein LTR69_004568 [Exophiala sideris]KAK5182292.1 hypothetical protein LTR44_005303 [Eurotiomycetes sp. CCFEE 6388]
MDGLQVDTSPREKASAQDTHKFVAPQTQPAGTYVTSPYTPESNGYTPAPQYESKPSTPDRRRGLLPCGLSLLAYTILVAAVTAIIIGAAVGGGLGGALASKSNKSTVGSGTATTATMTVTGAGATATMTATGTSSATSTSTGQVKNYAPLLPAQVNTTALDCNDKSTITSATGEQFQLNCNINYGGNDIINIIAYTLDACIEACSNLNTIANATTCHGIMFNGNMEFVVAEDNGNCWLKSLMAAPTTDTLPPSVGAVLLTS